MSKPSLMDLLGKGASKDKGDVEVDIDKPDDDGDDEEGAKHDACSAFLDAVESRDPAALADALDSIFELWGA